MSKVSSITVNEDKKKNYCAIEKCKNGLIVDVYTYKEAFDLGWRFTGNKKYTSRYGSGNWKKKVMVCPICSEKIGNVL